MPLLDLVVLALIQGVTEFLPISSSGHLVLWPLLTGRPDQGVSMDVAVHLGTLVAVCLYFRTDTGRLFRGGLDLARGRRATPEARLAALVALATVPAVVVGLGLKLGDLDRALRSVEVIGWTTLVGGIALWLADRYGPERRAERPSAETRGWEVRDALAMGLAQALALVPGTSRSGVCMTAARALGFRRDEAARLSLLMAIPVILAAGLVETASLVTRGPDPRVTSEAGAAPGTVALDLAVGTGLSFLAALAALVVMMRMFRTDWTMTPFVLYRLALGTGLLLLAYS